MNSLDQEVKDIALLQPQGLHNGEDALDKTATLGTVAAKGDFPPQDTAAQDALGVIVGGFNAFGDSELPQGRFQQHQVGAEVGRLGVGAAAARVEQLAQVSRHRVEPFLHALVRQPSAAVEVPGAEDSFDNPQASSANRGARSTAVQAFLKVAFKMSPADLSLQRGPQVVDTPAITAQDAVDGIAQQSGQAVGTALGVDDEGGHIGRGSSPQPTFSAGFFPTGFIDVF